MSESESKAYYFAYGSNLLSKRINVNIKTAVKHSNGLLNGYKLCFSGYANFWKGSTANIVPQIHSNVWGVIWTLSKSELEILHKQEVGYNAVYVDVCVDGTQQAINCLTFTQKPEYSTTFQTNSVQKSTEEDCDSGVICNIPSACYKLVIIKGAIEQNLPQDYIETVIKSQPDNGIMNCGPPDLL